MLSVFSNNLGVLLQAATDLYIEDSDRSGMSIGYKNKDHYISVQFRNYPIFALNLIPKCIGVKVHSSENHTARRKKQIKMTHGYICTLRSIKC